MIIIGKTAKDFGTGISVNVEDKCLVIRKDSGLTNNGVNGNVV